MKEKYQPTAGETQEAETKMTPEQQKMSEERNRQFYAEINARLEKFGFKKDAFDHAGYYGGWTPYIRVGKDPMLCSWNAGMPSSVSVNIVRGSDGKWKMESWVPSPGPLENKKTVEDVPEPFTQEMLNEVFAGYL